jgi:ribosome-associated protein
MAEPDMRDADREELVGGGAGPSEDLGHSETQGETDSTDARLADEQATTVERTPPPPEVLALGRRVVDVLADRQAADVVLLDISSMASFADYFVIGTGTSERHLVALRDAVDEALDEDGLQALQVEGEPDSGWVLMDYGDVVVHLFDARTRDYYKLERILSRGTTVVRVL